MTDRYELTDVFPRGSTKRSFGGETPVRGDAEKPRELDRNITWRVPPEYLIRRVLLGDSLARGALIEIIFRMGRKLLGNFDEEIRSRAIVTATDRLLGHGMLGLGIAHFDLRRSGAFNTWLAKILKRAAIDELRKRKLVAVPYSIATEGEDGEASERCPALVSQGHDAEGRPIIPGAASDVLREIEGREQLAAALAVLNEREQQVMLATAQGDSPEEIAERLELSASRVRGIITEARAKARRARDT
jgi:RNA polymerase sigma factor (sigma-70 family)